MRVSSTFAGLKQFQFPISNFTIFGFRFGGTADKTIRNYAKLLDDTATLK
jgi:hypothetical protein